VLKKRLKTFYKNSQLVRNKLGGDEQQLYRHILVIDFEATCDDTNPDHFNHEIIEFPVIVVNCESRSVVSSVINCLETHLRSRALKPFFQAILFDYSPRWKCIQLTYWVNKRCVRMIVVFLSRQMGFGREICWTVRDPLYQSISRLRSLSRSKSRKQSFATESKR